ESAHVVITLAAGEPCGGRGARPAGRPPALLARRGAGHAGPPPPPAAPRGPVGGPVAPPAPPPGGGRRPAGGGGGGRVPAHPLRALAVPLVDRQEHTVLLTALAPHEEPPVPAPDRDADDAGRQQLAHTRGEILPARPSGRLLGEELVLGLRPRDRARVAGVL